jgi:hypothetical protein
MTIDTYWQKEAILSSKEAQRYSNIADSCYS